MSTFRQEIRIIPRGAKILAALFWAGLIIAFSVVVNEDPNVRIWPGAAKFAFVVLVPILSVLYVLFLGYIYADARRRRMRYIMWTLLCIFVPYLIGVIVYFILRDSLPQPCPSCGVVVASSFVFCPHCGFTLKPTCPHCGKAVEHTWKNCAFCGHKLPDSRPQPSPLPASGPSQSF